MLAGNALKIEVATLAAVSTELEPKRGRPSVKATIAAAASPRAQARQADG
jgi:hypothetical protein